MPRYVAFLRGVSPMNLKMADLRRCLEGAGFGSVKTVLSSGNAAFDAAGKSDTKLARDVEAAMAKRLGRTFYTIVRRSDYLRDLIASDPYAAFRVPAGAKRVVTFLGEPRAGTMALPLEHDGARILAVKGGEVFTAYVPSPRGAVFMTVIEKAFGANVTTRTWDTVRKCAAA